MLRTAARRAERAFSSAALPAASVTTLHELGVAAGEAYGDARSLGAKDAATGEWAWTTFAQRAARAEHLGRALVAKDIRRGDRIACVSKNREALACTMYGAYAVGAAHVPLYEQQAPSEWRHILEDSGAKLLFVATAELASAARAVTDVDVVCFEDGEFEALLEEGAAFSLTGDPCRPADAAALIYTSGTTGKPKGVELTHSNLVWNALTMRDGMVDELLSVGCAKSPVRSLAVLPWAHIYGQTLELHAMLAGGHEVALCSDPAAFLDEAQEARPDVLFAVPALYNKIHDGFRANRRAMSNSKKALADRAVASGARRAKRCYDSTLPGPSFFEKLQHSILDALVLKKVRSALGGSVQFCGNGGAAVSPGVREFIEAIGIPMTSGYGLTETSPVLAKEKPFDPKNLLPGSIGKALTGVALKCVDPEGKEVPTGEPGELVASGPGVMRGYWGKPAETKEVLYEEGGQTWFRTGDRCVMEADGHVRVVGRVKELYKLANGKYVAPAPLEDALARSRYVAQAFVYGSDRAHNVCLVAPDWANVAKKFGVDGVAMAAPFTFEPKATIEALLEEHRAAIVELMEAEVAYHAEGFKSFERPERVGVVGEGFNAARGMITPKLSVKRAAVLAAHQADLDGLYGGGDDP